MRLKGQNQPQASRSPKGWAKPWSVILGTTLTSVLLGLYGLGVRGAIAQASNPMAIAQNVNPPANVPPLDIPSLNIPPLAESGASAVANPDTSLAQAPPEAEPLGSASQAGRVVGRILNQAGQPIPDATIQIDQKLTGPEQPPSSRSDRQGAFELAQPLAGRWRLQITHPSYEPQQKEVWFFPGMTTPTEITLVSPLEPQPRTRVGLVGVGELPHTEFLAQRLAVESLRLGLVPDRQGLLALDNRRLQPVLQAVGRPLHDLLNADRPTATAVGEFFDLLGLQGLVVARVDVLSRSLSPAEVSLRSRSRLELWTLDEAGNVNIQILEEANRDEREPGDLNAAEVEQLYQIQMTRMAQEVGERWQAANPLAEYVNTVLPDADAEPDPRPRIDTTVELALPAGAETPESSAESDSAPAFPLPLPPDSEASGEEADGADTETSPLDP